MKTNTHADVSSQHILNPIQTPCGQYLDQRIWNQIFSLTVNEPYYYVDKVTTGCGGTFSFVAYGVSNDVQNIILVVPSIMLANEKGGEYAAVYGDTCNIKVHSSKAAKFGEAIEGCVTINIVVIDTFITRFDELEVDKDTLVLFDEVHTMVNHQAFRKVIPNLDIFIRRNMTDTKRIVLLTATPVPVAVKSVKNGFEGVQPNIKLDYPETPTPPTTVELGKIVSRTLYDKLLDNDEGVMVFVHSADHIIRILRRCPNLLQPGEVSFLVGGTVRLKLIREFGGSPGFEQQVTVNHRARVLFVTSAAFEGYSWSPPSTIKHTTLFVAYRPNAPVVTDDDIKQICGRNRRQAFNSIIVNFNPVKLSDNAIMVGHTAAIKLYAQFSSALKYNLRRSQNCQVFKSFNSNVSDRDLSLSAALFEYMQENPHALDGIDRYQDVPLKRWDAKRKSYATRKFNFKNCLDKLHDANQHSTIVMDYLRYARQDNTVAMFLIQDMDLDDSPDIPIGPKFNDRFPLKISPSYAKYEDNNTPGLFDILTRYHDGDRRDIVVDTLHDIALFGPGHLMLGRVPSGDSTFEQVQVQRVKSQLWLKVVDTLGDERPLEMSVKTTTVVKQLKMMKNVKDGKYCLDICEADCKRATRKSRSAKVKENQKTLKGLDAKKDAKKIAGINDEIALLKSGLGYFHKLEDYMDAAVKGILGLGVCGVRKDNRNFDCFSALGGSLVNLVGEKLTAGTDLTWTELDANQLAPRVLFGLHGMLKGDVSDLYGGSGTQREYSKLTLNKMLNDIKAIRRQKRGVDEEAKLYGEYFNFLRRLFINGEEIGRIRAATVLDYLLDLKSAKSFYNLYTAAEFPLHDLAQRHHDVVCTLHDASFALFDKDEESLMNMRYCFVSSDEDYYKAIKGDVDTFSGLFDGPANGDVCVIKVVGYVKMFHKRRDNEAEELEFGTTKPFVVDYSDWSF